MNKLQHSGETLVAAVRYCLSNPSFFSYGVTQDVIRQWNNIPDAYHKIIANEIAATLDSWVHSSLPFDSISWCRILTLHDDTAKKPTTTETDIVKVKG